MIHSPARLFVWQSEVAASDFPPVCAMTGQAAETWRKFTFRKTPPWAFWVGGIILAAALAERTSGFLPLTRASAKKLTTVTWTFGSMIPLAVFFWLIGIVLAFVPTGGSFVGLFLLLGLGALFAGVIGLFIGRTAIMPMGKILDPQPGYYQSVIELRNVHPAFVAAVQQHQHARYAQAYARQAVPLPPESK